MTRRPLQQSKLPTHCHCPCFWRCNSGSLGGGTARQIGPCQPIKQPFPTSCLGRGGRAVSCLPLLPPNPAFHLPRTAAGVSTGLACLRGTPTAPPDHSCWSQEWAIETTEAHRICKPLFDSQRIKPQKWGCPGGVRTCSLQDPIPNCTGASARRPEAVDTHNPQRQQKVRLKQARETGWAALCKR